MNRFEQFAARLEEIHQESLSDAAQETQSAELIVPEENVYDSLYQVLKQFTDDQGRAIGSLLAMESISAIGSPQELEARLATLHPKSEGEISVSKSTAKKILGYGVKNEVVGGRKCSIYYPTEDTRGKSFCIPHVNKKGEKINDTFSTLLLRICLDMAGNLGVQDSLCPDVDMEAYHAAAAKGGQYRPFTVVRADAQGTIQVDPEPACFVAYDLSKAVSTRLMTKDGEKVYPLKGDLLKVFKAANLVVTPNGTANFGDGIRASGPFDPSSFHRGSPDATDETFETVKRLINVSKEKFKERYNLYVVQATPQAVSKPETVKGFAPDVKLPSLADVHFDPNWKKDSCVRASRGRDQSVPHLVMDGGKTKTIDVGCKFTYGGGESVQEEEYSYQGAQGGGDLLEQKAAAALLWLKNRSGSQLSDLDGKYPGIYGYSAEITAFIGKGTRRDKLAHFARSKTRSKAITLAEAAAEAGDSGLLPPVTLNGPDGEFEASDTLVFILALLKWCASIKFESKDGPNSVFYWDAKL